MRAVSVRQVLFVCTGNYYRSRFAELVFNARAAHAGILWRAFSRGLALTSKNIGPLSPYAIAGLRALDIDVSSTPRAPLPVQVSDLQAAAVIIALQESEHRPYLAAQFPAWVDMVEYWHVRDVIPTAAYDPLHAITEEVHQLLQRLRRPTSLL